VLQRFEFVGLYEAKLITAAYVDFCNNHRIHGGIGYITPQPKWDNYLEKKSVTLTSKLKRNRAMLESKPPGIN